MYGIGYSSVLTLVSEQTLIQRIIIKSCCLTTSVVILCQVFQNISYEESNQCPMCTFYCRYSMTYSEFQTNLIQIAHSSTVDINSKIIFCNGTCYGEHTDYKIWMKRKWTTGFWATMFTQLESLNFGIFSLCSQWWESCRLKNKNCLQGEIKLLKEVLVTLALLILGSSIHGFMWVCIQIFTQIQNREYSRASDW